VPQRAREPEPAAHSGFGALWEVEYAAELQEDGRMGGAARRVVTSSISTIENRRCSMSNRKGRPRRHSLWWMERMRVMRVRNLLLVMMVLCVAAAGREAVTVH
jgi:hypothetical protein